MLWRLLVGGFFRFFALSLLAILGLLLSTRLHDIAGLASNGVPLPEILRYSLYQVPFILPIAIPMAAFTGGWLLARHLFNTQELAALFACRLSLKQIFLPLIWTACLLGLTNTLLVSEGATSAHRLAKNLARQIEQTSPLAFLKKPKFLDRGSFSASASPQGGITLVFYQSRVGRLAWVSAQTTESDGQQLVAKGVTTLTSRPKEGFDDLLVEYTAETTATGNLLQSFSHRAKAAPLDLLSARTLRTIHTPQATTEWIRRISYGTATFVLSFVGFCFAARLQPRGGRRYGFIAITIAATVMGLLFFAKGLTPIVSLLLQLCTQSGALFISFLFLSLRVRGRWA